MAKSVKKAVSLLAEQDERVRRLTKSDKVSYSKILQDALKIYLKQRDIMTLEEEYARYYGNPKNAQKEEALADEMWRLSAEAFWEEEP